MKLKHIKDDRSRIVVVGSDGDGKPVTSTWLFHKNINASAKDIAIVLEHIFECCEHPKLITIQLVPHTEI